MDGNRRWAKSHKLEASLGHNSGAQKFGHVCDWCLAAGVPFLTVYAFSTENWRRDRREITHLLGLMEKYFREEKARTVEKDIRIRFIGDTSRFSAQTQAIFTEMENATAHCRTLTVQIALSYGGRDEIVRATQKIIAAGVQSITEATFESYLDTAGTPDVDMVIRTGGAENMRTSNFLPWQAAYAEWYFCRALWPDFSQEDFQHALAYFAAAKRNLGR
jgi:undecaprenyl diphosphate synthase